jgi:hypothetical protein
MRILFATGLACAAYASVYSDDNSFDPNSTIVGPMALSRKDAWLFDGGKGGYLIVQDRNLKIGVRCVGAAQ